MQRADFRHFLELAVRWGDMDAFGHVNNAQYFRYLESGRIAYLEEVLKQDLGANETVILADIQCAFVHQLRYPAIVEVATRVSRLGRTSIHLVSAIYRQGEEQPAATSKGVLVWFDAVRQRPTPIPAALRELVMGFEVLAPELGQDQRNFR